MKKEPVLIAFSTQKGGVGKTTFTVSVASYLHYSKGYNVLVVDCDYPQHSINQMRARDTALLEISQPLHDLAVAQFSKIDKGTYSILCAKPEEAVEALKEYLEESEQNYDFVFFDLAGTFNNYGIVETLSQIDYIITPISADKISLASTITFATVIKENIVDADDSKTKEIYLFWNQVDGRERTSLYAEYEKIISSLRVPIMRTLVPNKIRYKKEASEDSDLVFRSTIFPPSRALLRGSNFEDLVSEILEITNRNE